VARFAKVVQFCTVSLEPFQYQATAIDPDGDTLTYQLVNAPTNVTIDAATGLISWTPSSTNLGEREFQVKVIDGKGGEALQELNFNVIQATPNNAPTIISNPPIKARVNNLYVYQVGAEDLDGDPLSFNLTDAPDGMTIDARGRITWNPAASQLGSHTVEVTVADGQGGSATQSFTLNVNNRVTNQAPSITSTPNTVTNTERVYQYRGTAVDPDGDYLIWSLAQAPQGMVIDEETGVLSWQPTAQQIGEHTVSVQVIDAFGLGVIQTFTLSVTGNNTPPTSQQLGSHTVEVIVADTQNGVGRQTYTVEVGTTAINRPPTIDSQPSFFADVTSTYTYNVRASDPEGGTLTYSLLDAPSGMTIDANTGLIQWNPTSSQLGVARVSVAAFDPSGLGAVQTYSIQVQSANNAPIINSNPVLSAVPNTTYRYDVRANDPDREAIAYRLTQAPEGMSIDQLGRITWTPQSGDVGNYEIEIVVTDSRGATATQSYNLTVAADTTAPLVNLQFNRDRANIGETVTFQVNATDNVGVEELRLTFNGANIALDGNGRATVKLDAVGAFEVVAFATDAAGNRGEDTTTVFGIDPSDNQAPVVAFTNLTEPVEITSPLDIVGTVTDDNLLFYTLAIAPVGSDNFTEIARGTEPVSDGFLGQLDPAILSNDAYTLRLFALDAGGNQSVIETEVSIAGELKLGNFQLSFTDLSIPVSGIPIILTRTYDTLNANNNDDFGYGWRMEIRDTDLRTSVGKTGLEEDLIYNPYFAGARVYVTTPGGKREGFTFEPKLAPGLKGSFLGIWESVFVPDAGVTSSLTVEKFDLLRTSTGEFLGYGSSLGYNPSSPTFGGTFTLTTKEGIVYKIDGNTGDTRTVSDRNGNVLTFTDAGIFSNSGQKITFERNPRGQITAAIDPEGNRIEYEYDANGDLVAVTDRAGNVTRFDYNDNREHYLEEVIDPLGRTGARSEYDERGRLIKIIDADGKAVELIHNPANFVETVKDQLGNQTVYEYDERGNVLNEIDALGGVTKRTYDVNNNTLTETDPNGNTTTFTYDARGNVLTETDPLGNVTRFTYDSFGNILTTTDAQGNTTTNTYDRNGNLTSISGQANGKTTLNYDGRGNLASFGDAAGTTRFEYNSAGNVTRQVDAAGNVTTFTYDASGNQLSETRTLTTPNGVITLVTTTEYDSEGRVVKVTNPEGGVTETIYDAVGNRIEEIDPLGRSTKFIYSDRGLLIETIYPDSTPEDDLDNPRTRTEYDAAGQVTAEIDELGGKTQFVYDKLGRVTETIRPDETPNDDTDNPRTKTEYDAAGRVIAEIDERGNRTEFVYDNAGRQIATILPDETPNDNSDNPRFTTTYDTAGRQRTQTDALGNVTEFFYDDLGRPVGQKFADGTTVSSQFDESGRLIARTDQDGEVTRFEYDANGRLKAVIEVIDALEQRTEYGYDEQGNLISQKDARGNITKYEYDGLGRRIATVLPGGQRSTSEYDAVGNVIRTTDFNGETITYEYDERNRLIAENFPDGSSTTYTYDLVGQRKTVTDERGTTTYDYDAEGYLIKRIDPDGKEIAYTYDDAGNRTSVEIASGNTAYTYDELNRLQTVIDPDGGITSYFYNDNSNLIRTEFANGTVETRTYDSLNRLTYIETKDINGDIISSFLYELDAEGNRTQVTEHDGRIVKYYYDDLDRLEKEEIFDSGATVATRTIEYAYDVVGNRLSRVDSGEGTTIYTYDNNDRLLTETTDGVATTYTYDDNGNTISKTTGAETVTYEWDAENRLVGADTDGDGAIDLTNQYDADGVRVAQTVNGEETRFLIDTNRPYAQVLEEYTEGGIIQVSYVHGNDLISQERNGQESFYHVDGLGSTRALSDESGLTTDRYIYDAFGRVLTKIGDTDNSYLYAGEQRDQNLGFDYLRARYLNFKTGRFVSRDTFEGDLRAPLTLNKHLYANANPVNFIDPSGFFSLASISVANSIRSTLASIQFEVGNSIMNLLQFGFDGTLKGIATGAITSFGAIVLLNIGGKIFRRLEVPKTSRNASRGILNLQNLDDNEIKLVNSYITQYGGVFDAAPKKFPAIDGFLNGRPIELKSLINGQTDPQAVLTAFQKKSARGVAQNIRPNNLPRRGGFEDFSIFGFDVWISAPNVKASELLKYEQRTQNFYKTIVNDGTVNNLFVLTKDGWVGITTSPSNLSLF
jgi:RHS repeat-associated protein